MTGLCLTDGSVIVGRPWLSAIAWPDDALGETPPATLADLISRARDFDIAVPDEEIRNPQFPAVHTQHLLRCAPNYFGAGQHAVGPSFGGYVDCRYPRPVGRVGSGAAYFHFTLTRELWVSVLTMWRPESRAAYSREEFVEHVEKCFPGLIGALP